MQICALIPAGILSDVLNYVLQHAKDVVTSQSATTPAAEDPKLPTALVRRKTIRSGTGYTPTSMEAVFVESFTFLKAIARNNLEVQQRYMHCSLTSLIAIVRWGLFISSSLPCLQTV